MGLICNEEEHHTGKFLILDNVQCQSVIIHSSKNKLAMKRIKWKKVTYQEINIIKQLIIRKILI